MKITPQRKTFKTTIQVAVCQTHFPIMKAVSDIY